MILYHGTTRKRAARIRAIGFLPHRSRIWFSTDKQYANRRAKTQARRASDHPVTLTCDLNMGILRQYYGSRGALKQGHVVVVRGKIPPSVLVDATGDAHLPYIFTADQLAKWINGVLRVKPHKGVSRRHPGILRLELWIRNRLANNPKATFTPKELLSLAWQWIPEHLSQFKIDPETLRAVRIPVEAAKVEWPDVSVSEQPVSPDEERIINHLMAKKPSGRIKGLRLLAESEDPDLFEWCVMFFDDPEVEVRVSVLETMRVCEDPETEMIADLVDDEDKRIRAAAIAFMTKHGEDQEAWFRMGLTDPDTHVRVVTTRYLDELDAAVHHSLFELALYDPNPKVQEAAKKMTAGKGYEAEQWSVCEGPSAEVGHRAETLSNGRRCWEGFLGTLIRGLAGNPIATRLRARQEIRVFDGICGSIKIRRISFLLMSSSSV